MTADQRAVSFSAMEVFRYKWIEYSTRIRSCISLLLPQADTSAQIHPLQSCPLDARQRALLLAIARDAAHTLHIWYLMQSVYDSTCALPSTASMAIADMLGRLQDWFAPYGVVPKLPQVDPALCVRGNPWDLSLALFALLYPVEFAPCEPLGCKLASECEAGHIIFRMTSAIDMRQQQGIAAVCAEWSSVDIARRLIERYEGSLSMEQRDDRLICAVSLPLAAAGELPQVDEHRSAAGGSIPQALLRRWQRIGQGYCQSAVQHLHELSTVDVLPQRQDDFLSVVVSHMMTNVRRLSQAWDLFVYHCAPVPPQPQAGQTTVAAILAVAREQLGRFGAALALDAPTPAAHVPGDAERLGRALAYLLYPFEYEMHEPSRCALSLDALPDQIVFHITSGVHLRGMIDMWLPPYDYLSISPAREVIALYGGTVSIDLRGDMLHATVRLPLAAG